MSDIKLGNTATAGMTREELIKYLGMIEAIIARLASNSFFLKGWSVTIAAALFGLAAKDTNPAFALVALIPTLAFWSLDAFYLHRERLFRALYEDVRMELVLPTHSVEPFCMITGPYKSRVKSWFKTLWSPSVVLLHGTIVLIVGIAIVLLSL